MPYKLSNHISIYRSAKYTLLNQNVSDILTLLNNVQIKFKAIDMTDEISDNVVD